MGSARLSQLDLARRGIPWHGVGVVSIPAAILTICAFVFHESAMAWPLLRSGILLWALAVAFVLDEPASSAADATPRSPTWWFSARILGGAPLLVLPVSAGFIWAIKHPLVEPAGLAIQTISASLLVLAAAAVARRLGRDTPGNLVASSAVLVALFLLTFPASINGVPILPLPTDPKWNQSTALWAAVGAVAMSIVAVAVWWRPHPKRAITTASS